MRDAKTTLLRYSAAVLLLGSGTQAYAQAVAGTATAQDGDSLLVGATRVRLFGIDAPELDQTCQRDGTSWPCGEAARTQLAELVAGRQVECNGQGVDQHGRVLAICRAGREQLNQVMVEQGWALAYREFSDQYVPAELEARTRRLGIWTSTFALPGDHRMAKLPPVQRAAAPPTAPGVRHAAPERPGGCVIKGNRNRRGQWIYHLPGMPYYDQTRAEEIFCSEAAAQAAGYRRAIVRP